MSNGIFIEGFKAIIDGLSAFKLFETERFYNLAAGYVKSQILKRTSEGIDADYKRFKPYSPSWKYVRKKLGYPISKVDLFFSGTMLSSITWMADKNQATVFFRPTTDRRGRTSSEKAYYNQHGRQPRRFFAMSEKDMDYLVTLYLRLLKEKVGL